MWTSNECRERQGGNVDNTARPRAATFGARMRIPMLPQRRGASLAMVLMIVLSATPLVAIDPYLSRSGFDASTARISVTGHPNDSMVLSPKSPFLVDAPNHVILHTSERTALLFLDLDCGGRGESDALPGKNGPCIHGVWTDCRSASVGGCDVVRAYRRPGGSKGRLRPNRYVFLLFAQKAPVLALPDSGKRLDLPAFVAANRDALSPRAYAVVQVGGPCTGTP